jgi:hypothetical protein
MPCSFRTTAAAALLITAMISGAARAQEAETATPRVLTFGAESARAGQPVVLRGSAMAPRKAPAAAAASTSGYQVVGGQRLWFYDPETKDVRSCINQQTSTVGVRIVRCATGTLGGYRRTFGVTFQP